MSDTPEIAGAKRKLADQATELPNWSRQLLDYIAQVERELADMETENALVQESYIALERDKALREVVEAFVAETVDYMARNKLGPDVNARGVSEPPQRRAGDTPFCDDDPETVASGRLSKYCRMGECERKERGGTRCKIKAETPP